VSCFDCWLGRAIDEVVNEEKEKKKAGFAHAHGQA
jgi:hypothetical protein